MVGARGSFKQTQFEDRLTLLGVAANKKSREKIPTLTVARTLALSNIILKIFHTTIFCSPEWALSSLSLTQPIRTNYHDLQPWAHTH